VFVQKNIRQFVKIWKPCGTFVIKRRVARRHLSENNERQSFDKGPLSPLEDQGDVLCDRLYVFDP